MTNLDTGDDFFDFNAWNMDSDPMGWTDIGSDDYSWMPPHDHTIEGLPMQADDGPQAQQVPNAQQAPQQSQMSPYREQDAPDDLPLDIRQAENGFTSMHEPDLGMENIEQTFSSLEDPVLQTQTFANCSSHGQMPSYQSRGCMTMPVTGVAHTQRSTRYSNRQLLDDQAFAGSTSHNQGFISMHGNAEQVQTSTRNEMHRSRNTVRRSSHDRLPHAQSVDICTTSMPTSVRDRRLTGLVESPENQIGHASIQTRRSSRHRSARYEILEMRQEGTLGTSLDQSHRTPTGQDTFRGSCERSISPDRIVVAPRATLTQRAGAANVMSRSRNQRMMPVTSARAVATPRSPLVTNPIPTVQPLSLPLYTPSNITSADDALRIAFRAVGERRLLKDTTCWRAVQEAHHTWAKEFFDVLLENPAKQLPINLDEKGTQMYANQQNRFTEKLNTLIVKQGKKYNSVLAQICANCYLQVEAVIVLHRDGVPKLDLDESTTGSRSQRQKLDMEMPCYERLDRMIDAVRDLKSIAFDVATGKNQHLFAYSPQGYINGKLGNIQSNATRKGRRGEEGNATSAHGRPSHVEPSHIEPRDVHPEVITGSDRASQVVSYPRSQRRRRVSNVDSTIEVDDETLDPDYIDYREPKRRRYDGV